MPSSSPSTPPPPAGCDQVPTPTGRLLLTAKRFVGPDPDALLARLGPDATIVCLNPERELQQWPGYIEWLRTSPQAIWYSMPDWNAPPLAEVEPLLDMIVDRLGDGHTVVVHCSHGQGRTGTIAVAVLMRLGETQPEALRLVAEHRPGAGPLEGSQSRLIRELARSLADD